MTKSAGKIMILAALCSISAAPALAQLSAKGGAIDIKSDKLEVYDAKNEAIFIGRVDAVQNDARLRADKLDVLSDKLVSKSGNTSSPGASWGAVHTIIATGNVYYVTPKQVAKADKAIYNVAKDQVTMLGDVVVTQGKNVIRGNKLVLQISSGRAVFVPGPKKPGKSGRVRAVFFPAQDDTKPATDTPDSDKKPASGSGE